MTLANLRQNLDFLSTLKGVVTLLRDPTQTESVYDVEDGLRHTKATELAVEYVKSKPEVAALFQERYLAPSVNLEALLQLSPDSLGHVYATYIKDSGFPTSIGSLKAKMMSAIFCCGCAKPMTFGTLWRDLVQMYLENWG